MELGISPSALSKWLLQRGRARAGAECLRAKTGQSSKPGASTGPRPRGRGMSDRARRQALDRRCFNGAAPARARNGPAWISTSCQATCFNGAAPARARNVRPGVVLQLDELASTGPRPRGRGMASPVTLSGTGSQQLNCDCLRPSRYPSLLAVNQSHTICSKSSVYVMRAPEGVSASPRLSRVQLSKNTKGSDHITRRVQFHIRQSQCRNYPIPSPFRWSQPNKNYLILIVVDDFGQS